MVLQSGLLDADLDKLGLFRAHRMYEGVAVEVDLRGVAGAHVNPHLDVVGQEKLPGCRVELQLRLVTADLGETAVIARKRLARLEPFEMKGSIADVNGWKHGWVLSAGAGYLRDGRTLRSRSS